MTFSAKETLLSRHDFSTCFSLESISLDDFLSRIRELLPDNLTASSHPSVQDVVIIRSIAEEVKPEDVVSGNLVVVGALCAAAVLRGADVYAPGVQAAPNNLQVLSHCFLFLISGYLILTKLTLEKIKP